MQGLRRYWTRARGADPRRFDAALAGVLLLACLVETALLHDHGANRWLTIPVAVVGVTPLAWRRAHTTLACLAFAVAALAGVAADTLFMDEMTTPFLVIGILFYSLGRYSQGRAALAGALALYLPINAILLFQDNEQVKGIAFLWSIALLAPPYAAGRIMRRRVQMQTQLRALTARLEAGRGERERRAIEGERGRIAEELQTLVANNVSAMVVQAGAVRPALATATPADADRALATIEETGRDALVEMRRLLGVLRRDDTGAALAPQPTLEQAEALAERARAAGLPVQMRVDGHIGPLPTGVDLAAYRVLQETLDSAHRVDSSREADVLLTYGERELLVAVAVRDDGRDGLPLTDASLSALRERVSLYGGTLRAGRLPDGHGFRVTARLPLEAGA